jgi:hypothetical protein
MFADLLCDAGQRCVPPMILALVIVLRREGCSDRDAVERFTFDARWKYAAGCGQAGGAGRSPAGV